MSACLSKISRTSATEVPWDAALLAAFTMDSYSMTVGATCASITPITARMPPKKISPMKERPRCLDFDGRSIRCPLPFKQSLMDRTNGLEVAKVHPDEDRLANNVLVRNEPPIARVE